MNSVHCKKCGSVDLITTINEEGHMHYSRITCNDCKQWTWGKKPENENKRSDRNETWKKIHRHDKGKLICAWCRIDETMYSDNRGWMFQLDHIIPIYKGGFDEFKNTQILCFQCHNDKTQRMKQVDEVRKKIESLTLPNEKNIDEDAEGLPF